MVNAIDELVGDDSILDDMLNVLGVSIDKCSDVDSSGVQRLRTIQTINNDIRTVVEGCFKNAQLFFTGYPGVPQITEVDDLQQITASLQTFLNRAVASVVTAADNILNTDLTSTPVLITQEFGD